MKNVKGKPCVRGVNCLVPKCPYPHPDRDPVKHAARMKARALQEAKEATYASIQRLDEDFAAFGSLLDDDDQPSTPKEKQHEYLITNLDAIPCNPNKDVKGIPGINSNRKPPKSRNEEIERKTCLHCGRKFSLDKKEKDFYVRKNYSLPKRCGPCRKIRREDAKFPSHNAEGCVKD